MQLGLIERKLGYLLLTAIAASSCTVPGLAQGLPPVFQHPYVPTDTTGIGGSLGHAKGLRQQILGPDRKNLPDSKGVVAFDPRYTFIGRWLPLQARQARLACQPLAVPISEQTLSLSALVNPKPQNIFCWPAAGVDRFRSSQSDFLDASGTLSAVLVM